MTIDFVCIGAQKAGTTSLHDFLAAHPDIVVPADKEVPLLNRDDLTIDQVRSELQALLVPPDLGPTVTIRHGQVTPHYLTSPLAADRLGRLNPDAVVLLLVRDRLSRATSHYRMMRRRQVEARPFEQAVRAELDRLESGLHSGPGETDPEGYVSGSLYGHHLRPYVESLGPEQITIIDMAALSGDTSGLSATLARVLDVSADGFPSTVPHSNPSGRAGAMEQAYYRVRRRPLVRHLVRVATTSGMRRRLYWAMQRRPRHADDGIDTSLADDTRARLSALFDKDQELVEMI